MGDFLFYNMEYIVIRQYDNYIPANIDLGMLQEEGINCWLKDENTVTIDPILSNAIGGIKLMAAANQVERALSILRTVENEQKKRNPCPQCNSYNIELVSTPRKASNWLSVILGLFITSYAIPIDKVFHCFNCGHEFPEEGLNNNAQNATLNK
jgi:transcription elongation factor Elf1